MCPEPGQVLILSADICGQNERPQLPLYTQTVKRHN